MIRVLHLLRRSPDFQSEQSSAVLARRAGSDFHVTTHNLGHGATIHNLLASIWSLRKVAGEFDVIHAWDMHALRAAAYATRLPIVFSPSTILKTSDFSLLRRTADAGRLQIVCSTENHRRRVAAAGIPPRVCHLIRPAVEMPRARQIDQDLRASLGIAPGDLVLLAPGESTRAAGHQEALWTTSILHVLNPNIRILLWGRGDRVDDLLKLSAKLSQPRLLCVAERRLGRPVEFERLTSAADIALLTGAGGAAPLAGLLCIAADLPAVATAADPVNEVLNKCKFAVAHSPLTSAGSANANTVRGADPARNSPTVARNQRVRVVFGASARLLAQEVLQVSSNLREMKSPDADAIAKGLEYLSPASFTDAHHRLYREVIQLHNSGIAQLLA